MTPEQFCYWLRGIFEIQKAGLDVNEKRVPKFTEAQIEMIDRHLESCFKATVTMPLQMPTTPLKDLMPFEMPKFPDLGKVTIEC